MPSRKPTLEEKFWKRVQKTDTCWLWTGTHFVRGYGRLVIKGKALYAHRLAYELLVEPIPPNGVLHHKCEVLNCVNPDHLELMTQGEHMSRYHTNAPTFRPPRRTVCRKGLHPMTGDNIYTNPRGDRVCRACQREYARAYRIGRQRSAAR